MNDFYTLDLCNVNCVSDGKAMILSLRDWVIFSQINKKKNLTNKTKLQTHNKALGMELFTPYFLWFSVH